MEQPSARVERTFVAGRYGQIHCRVADAQHARQTIICLHMSPKSGRSFHQLMPYLATRYRVLAPDYPGYGESDAPPPQPPVTVQDYADAVWQVADAVGVGPVHFVGYHTGSMVAVEAAMQRGDAVRSVINISAPLFNREELQTLDATYSPLPLDEAGTRFKALWERVIAHRGPGMTLAMAAESFAENLRGGEHYEWGHRAAFAYAPRYAQQLAKLQLPVLVLNPRDDCWEVSARADPLLRNGHREDLPAWGHGFLQAWPAQAAQKMLSFIDQHGAEQ